MMVLPKRFLYFMNSLYHIQENQLTPSILTKHSAFKIKMRRGNPEEQEADTKTFQEILSKLVRMKRTETFKSFLSSDSKELAWFVSLADVKNGNPGRWLEQFIVLLRSSLLSYCFIGSFSLVLA